MLSKRDFTYCSSKFDIKTFFYDRIIDLIYALCHKILPRAIEFFVAGGRLYTRLSEIGPVRREQIYALQSLSKMAEMPSRYDMLSKPFAYLRITLFGEKDFTQ